MRGLSSAVAAIVLAALSALVAAVLLAHTQPPDVSEPELASFPAAAAYSVNGSVFLVVKNTWNREISYTVIAPDGSVVDSGTLAPGETREKRLTTDASRLLLCVRHSCRPIFIQQDVPMKTVNNTVIPISNINVGRRGGSNDNNTAPVLPGIVFKTGDPYVYPVFHVEEKLPPAALTHHVSPQCGRWDMSPRCQQWWSKYREFEEKYMEGSCTLHYTIGLGDRISRPGIKIIISHGALPGGLPVGHVDAGGSTAPVPGLLKGFPTVTLPRVALSQQDGNLVISVQRARFEPGPVIAYLAMIPVQVEPEGVDRFPDGTLLRVHIEAPEGQSASYSNYFSIGSIRPGNSAMRVVCLVPGSPKIGEDVTITGACFKNGAADYTIDVSGLRSYNMTVVIILVRDTAVGYCGEGKFRIVVPDTSYEFDMYPGVRVEVSAG